MLTLREHALFSFSPLHLSFAFPQAHFVANCFGSGARRATASAEAAKARALQHAQQLSPAQGAASNGHGSSNGTSSSSHGGGGSGSSSSAAPLVADDPGDADWEEGAAARQSTASRGAASTTPTPYSMSAARGRRLYLLIHNLDGPSLRSPEVQTALSVLAGADRICVTASVDHVNSALLMDQRQRQRGNWVRGGCVPVSFCSYPLITQLWHDVTTYAPYLEETAYMESVLQSRKELNFDRLSFVLQSLTPNHRAVLRVLAQHHVDDKDTAGMLFRTYCQACMDNMLVSSDQGFRGLMVELQVSHLVVVSLRKCARSRSSPAGPRLSCGAAGAGQPRGHILCAVFGHTCTWLGRVACCPLQAGPDGLVELQIARMLDLLVRWKDA